jgi:hypothetical protein
MIFKKDNFIFGFIMGMIAPALGVVLFKYTKLAALNFYEAMQFMILQPGHKLLTLAITLSLMTNAILFTLYINAHIDKTAKGIFVATFIYAIVAIVLKTIN